MNTIQSDFEQLKLRSIIGFSGDVRAGLIKHPDGVHSIYSFGSTVVVKNSTAATSQEFLNGHTNTVTCLALSKDGKLIASGQITHMGFQADIIVWDFETKSIAAKLSLHKVKVQALAFSPSGKYLASLGGEDDNSIIVWDLEKKTAICGAPASSDSSGATITLSYLNNSDLQFVTGGAGTLRVWELNPAQRKIRPNDVQTGQIKRVVKCIAVDKNDELMYCGTTTGDLMQVNITTRLFKNSEPRDKKLFSLGILSAALSPKGEIVAVGCGDGTVALLSVPKMTILKTAKVEGGVSSIVYENESQIAVGTVFSNIYSVQINDFKPVLQTSCHYNKINDIVFPKDSSDVFATASDTDIRIWNAQKCSELVRIKVPNSECKCIVFKNDGKSIISGWNDKIRSFGPQTGRQQFEINDAHKSAVTALAVTDIFNATGDYRIVSGGADGQVRVWRINRNKQTLEGAMKEHKGTVTCIKIRKNNLECVSSSSDGSCIIWDLTRHVRNQVLFAPSFFKCVSYYPDESQLLTCGTDRKVGYWEVFDGSLIRELEASQSESVNSLDISKDGKYFVIGGSDKMVKLYRYEEGDIIAVGIGHSSDISKVSIAPDNARIVTVSAAGAIFQWEMPAA